MVRVPDHGRQHAFIPGVQAFYYMLSIEGDLVEMLQKTHTVTQRVTLAGGWDIVTEQTVIPMGLRICVKWRGYQPIDMSDV